MASLKKRGEHFYAQIYIGGQQKRIALRTTSYKIAREKLRQIESAHAGGATNPLPTRTPIGQIVQKYVEHIRTVKTAKSAQTDVYYLRDLFGPCCDAVQITSRRPSPRARKRPRNPGTDARLHPAVIEAACFETITTSQIQDFIDRQVRSRGLAPKSANRYREIACRLFNWSMKQGLIRMPERLNPVASVERHREPAPKI